MKSDLTPLQERQIMDILEELFTTGNQRQSSKNTSLNPCLVYFQNNLLYSDCLLAFKNKISLENEEKLCAFCEYFFECEE